MDPGAPVGALAVDPVLGEELALDEPVPEVEPLEVPEVEPELDDVVVGVVAAVAA